MNTLQLEVCLLRKDQSFWLDGIEFKSCALVLVDKKSFLGSISALRDALVVPSELQAARSCVGKYLIFTNASGIADDGGWSGVRVSHGNSSTIWDLFIDDVAIRAEFDREQYENEIDRVLSELARLPPEVEIEPVQVMYPEDW